MPMPCICIQLLTIFNGQQYVPSDTFPTRPNDNSDMILIKTLKSLHSHQCTLAEWFVVFLNQIKP